MTKKILKSKSADGTVVELLAQDGDVYWVKRRVGEDDARWTTDADRWEPYTPSPKVGEVWEYPGGSSSGFRVLAVDTESGYWLMTPNISSNITDSPFNRPFEGDFEGRMEVPMKLPTPDYREYVQLYYRPLPESRMVPKEFK